MGKLGCVEEKKGVFIMKISTKGRYALRLMLDLAEHYNGDYIPLKEIAARQEISDKYLEQLIMQLNRAGFIQSVRGSRGGYRLAKAPEEYSIGSILRVMEGSLAPVACVEEGQECERAESCATYLLWQDVRDAVNNVVDHRTLKDLMDSKPVKAVESMQ